MASNSEVRFALTSHAWWPTIRRTIPLVFLVAVAALIVWRARAIDWAQVMNALRDYRAVTLWTAALFAALSYTVYSFYDLVGRAYTRHTLVSWKVMRVAAISYAFNLNFGTLVGGMGFRYRLYSQAGLKPGTTTRVLAMSVVGNWLGWFGVAGTAFALGWVPLPPNWTIGAVGLQVAGVILLALAAGYLALCAFSRRRSWVIRGFQVQLPSLKLAGGQLALALLNWLLMSAIMFVLLRPYVPFSHAMGVLMMSAVASVLIRVPAGLGVIEAVFLALLGSSVGEPRLLAALLAYRAIYYFAPLLVASLAYGFIEGRARLHARRRRA